MHQCPHALIVIGALKGDLEITLLKHTPKRFLGGPTAGFPKKIHSLGKSGPSRHHRTGQTRQTRHARIMIGLSLINKGNERAGIRENHLPRFPDKARLKATPALRALPPLEFIRPINGAKL